MHPRHHTYDINAYIVYQRREEEKEILNFFYFLSSIDIFVAEAILANLFADLCKQFFEPKLFVSGLSFFVLQSIKFFYLLIQNHHLK